MLAAVFCVVGAVLLLPALVLLVETMAALLPERDRASAVGAVVPRVVVLVPAHNESLQIASTVRALIQDLPAQGSVLVVADNCTDDTASLASGAGASVVERSDLSRVGKGFAISKGLDHLSASPPDVVVIFDADCRISPNGVRILGDTAARSGRPVQAEYLLGVPEHASPMTVVSAMAVLLRNRVRPRGLDRLGLPCSLTGSGMAFPWQVLRGARATGSNLVEDLTMGIDLALQGHPPKLCRQASVDSLLPEGGAASLRQRRRWEQGQLQTLIAQAPRLMVAGIVRRQLFLVALGLDLMVPPLALLVGLQMLWLLLMVLSWALKATSGVPAAIAAAGLIQVGVAVMAAWIGFGRRTIPLRQLIFMPLYLVWKIPFYLALIFGRRQKKWERTPRRGEPVD